MVAWAQTRQTNDFLEAINGLLRALKCRAHGFTRIATIKIIIFLIAGKLEFKVLHCFAMVSYLRTNSVFFRFLCLSIALTATGCGREPASPEKHSASRLPPTIGDQSNFEVQATIPTTIQVPVMPPAALSDTEKEFRPQPKGDPFLLAATASSNVLTPLPTAAISSAQSLEEVSELIRQQAQERPANAAGMNPFTSLSTTPRKP